MTCTGLLFGDPLVTRLGVGAPHLPLATSSCLTTVGELRDEPYSLHSDTLKELITLLETLSTIGSSCDTPGVGAPHLPLATSSCLTTVGELRDEPYSLHSDTLKELITLLETLSTIGSSCDTPGVGAPHLPLATSSCLTTVGELRDEPYSLHSDTLKELITLLETLSTILPDYCRRVARRPLVSAFRHTEGANHLS
ncbi:hypothetical protein J6590_062163 [Homalodisca vitripennis]|nr:hypothetical protein J6590_062163 [Homalodisca vitripennis]